MSAVKKCLGCGEAKSVDCFTKKSQNKSGLNARCRVCTQEMSRAHFERNKDYYRKKQSDRRKELIPVVKAYIQGERDRPCADCKRVFPLECMDFDHIRGKKKFDVGGSHRDRSLKQIKEEIEKCEVVCSNCHRIRTRTRRLMD